MNKKFSTLLAAFLAAGALTTANATDFKDIANGGRYFQLEQTGQFSSGWVAAPASGYFMSLDAAGKVIFSKTQKDWWTVVSKQVAGQTYFQLVNKDGRAFSYTYNDGTKDVKIDWFLSDYAAANINDLSFMKAGTRTYLGCGAQRGTTDVWDLAEAVGATNPRGFDAIEVSTEYTRTMINSIKGDGFGLQIGYLSAKTKDFADYALKGAEALQGKLVAVDNMSGADATTNAKDFYLFNSSAKAYVVLVKDKWSVNGTDLLSGTGKGYKWTLMTKKQYDADKALGAYSTIIADKFSFTETYYTNGPRLEVVALDAYDATTPSVIDADAELFVAEVDASNYLTTNAAINAAGTLTHGDKDGLPSYYSATWVRFGDSNVLDASEFYGYAVTVLGLNKATENKTLRPVFTTAGTAEWVNAEYVAMTQPEGQWIYTGEWTNRETGENASAWFNGLRHDSGDVYYEVRGGETYKYELKKTDALGGNSFNYYGEYEASNEAAGEPRSYKISFYNKTSEEYNYVGFNGKGELILTNNVANAVVFDLAKVKKTNDMNAQGKVEADALVDVINIINPAILKNQKGEWQRYANGDTISFYRYTFNYGGKQLKYDANSGKLTLTTAGDYFVIKQKDGDVVNVLNVGTKDYDNTSVVGTDATGKYSQKYAPKNWECGRELLTGKWVANTAIDAARNTYDKAEMLYFDNNHALLKQQANIYQWEANAQLVIDDDATVAYRSLEAHKTYEFFRTEFSDEFLFERGEFLGMTTNRFDYNPAIFVDTAYVRNETVKPLYMLAVGVDQTPESTYCPIHGTEPCDHALDVPGNIAARYLVSYTDSVAKYAALVQNPFCYTNTKLTKLGFVPAIHTVDSVFVGEDEEPTFVFGEQKVTPITFAFRIVNPETEDFIIETGAKTNNGYTTNFIKWHNGCPVLTANMNEAEVFNVRASEAEATANEAVEAGEVSVVAAQGAIIVKGAAGKVVTVANILGQTIANQVAASDNVTIAAPAGIAVVTVDGEATKVVVK